MGLIEQPIYGSSRIGTYIGKTKKLHRTLGNKIYELSNHLGNILATITDAKIYQTNGSLAKVISGTDYYAFGAAMPSRSYQDAGYSKYRYGFNNMEKDEETGTHHFKYREDDQDAGRFWSVDPLAAQYPWNSPYAFAENRVIDGIDLEGLEHKNMVRALWDSESKTFVLFNPTEQEIKKITTVSQNSVYYTGHHQPGWIQQVPNDAGVFESKFGLSGYRRLVVIHGQQGKDNFFAQNNLPNQMDHLEGAIHEGEYAHYMTNYLGKMKSEGSEEVFSGRLAMTLNELDNTNMEETTRNDIIIDQANAFLPLGNYTKRYTSSGDKGSLIKEARDILEKRDLDFDLGTKLNKGIRFFYGADSKGKVYGSEVKFDTPNKNFNKGVSVNIEKGVLTW